MSQDDFYLAFENRHRGTRALIQSRLQVYVPFIQPLLDIYPHATSLDLGCGRGEWLELLTGLGFDARGVDTDPAMVHVCQTLNLRATQQDAIQYLMHQPDKSLAIISAFHVVEHIPFDQLQLLVEHARRCLLPGGLMVLETPNPENLAVGTSSFYVDPTHQRPIPPELLSFLPEYYGFSRHKVLRLQESAELRGMPDIDMGLAPVIFGASPDYAVLAQAHAESEVLQRFDAVFSFEHGLSTLDLARRYDRGVHARATEVAHDIGSIRHELHDMKTRLNTVADRSRALNDELVALREHAARFEREYQAVRASWSWRLTAPLRMVGSIVGYGATRERSTDGPSQGIVSRAVTRLMASVLQDPRRAARLNQWIMRMPRIHRRLRSMAIRSGLMEESASADTYTMAGCGVSKTHSLESMPRSAREIHAMLDRLSGRP